MASQSFPKLRIETGPSTREEIELRKAEFFIGREAGVDLVIQSPAVSRRHLRLLRKGSQVSIEDLSSANGTFLNGRRLSVPEILQPGDRISLGQAIHLRFIGFPEAVKTDVFEVVDPEGRDMKEGTLLETGLTEEPRPEPADQLAEPLNPVDILSSPDDREPHVLTMPVPVPRAAPPQASQPLPAQARTPSAVRVEYQFAKPELPPSVLETRLGDDSAAAAPSAPRLILEVAGASPEAYQLLGDRITIGRSPENDIVVSSRIVSGRHAEIEKIDGHYFFRPLPDITNPVYFEGRPLQAGLALRSGDILRIGGSDPGLMVTFEFQPEGKKLETQAIQFGENNRVQIGRDPSNDIVLAAPTVSRFHAIVERVGQRYRVRDLKSGNGTFVNDRRIEEEVWLKSGDAIRIGPARFDVGQDRVAQASDVGGMRVEILGLNKWVRSDLNLLKDISLIFEPREFIVVVGQSGGGKSTLLDAVAGFRPATHGRVLVNDIDIYLNFDAIRNEIGFVPQKDIIHMELTVYQALDYAAQLRMPADTSGEERRQRVMEVLQDLDLVHRKDVQISGLSGGQQKRVSIGVELLTRPGLFFLDEPTSGLDPGTETALMHLMRRLADQGRTIVLITHATKNVMLADKVVFLARGGYIAWFGPPNEALQFFDQFRSERDRHARSMEFDEIYAILDDPSKGKAEDWAERYRNHPAYQEQIVRPLQALGRSVSVMPGEAMQKRKPAAQPRQKGSRSPSSGIRQFSILSGRNIKILGRDRASLILMLISAPLVAMLNVLLAVILGRNLFSFQEGDIANAIVSVFQPVIFAIMVGALSQMREFVKESEIYRRERLVNLKVLPYVMSKIWVAALLALYQAAAYVIIQYLAFKMPGGVLEFVLIYITLVLATLSGMMLGLVASAASPNANSAPLIVILLIIPQVVTGGALIPMPTSVSAMTLSRWPFETLIAVTAPGSSVAADACWALPEDVREAMTLEDKLEQGCLCLGINALREESCSFPGLGEFYDPAIDEPEPVEPVDIGDPPPEPEMPPAPAEPADPNDRVAVALYLQDLKSYQDSVQKIQNEYRATVDDYQDRAEKYKTEVRDYQENRTEWEINRNAAVGKAEGLIKQVNDNFGWAFVDKDDANAYWSRLAFSWAMQGMIIIILFGLILFFIYRKDRVK